MHRGDEGGSSLHSASSLNHSSVCVCARVCACVCACVCVYVWICEEMYERACICLSLCGDKCECFTNALRRTGALLSAQRPYTELQVCMCVEYVHVCVCVCMCLRG